MQLSIITPEKTLFSAAAKMVTIPGSEGEFGVLPGHAPFISTLRPGVITIDMENGEKRRIGVISGFAEVVPSHCTVLAENAVLCDGMTTADIQARFDEAKTALDAAVDDAARREAQKKLELAEAIRFTLGQAA